jgi:hypothetical protein
MRKQTGNIATLPYSVRRQLNEKLRDNRSLRAVAEWLFGLNDPDAGVPCALRWMDDEAGHDAGGDVTEERERALKACVMALCRYRQSPEYRAWLVEDTRNEAVGQITTNMAALADAGKGGDALGEAAAFNQLMLSVAGEKLLKIMRGEGTVADAAILFKSGTKLVVNAVNIEDARRERDKFARETCTLFLKWVADKKARDIAESNMSSADKIAALRAEYFKDIDALEKSGEVQLPA